MRNFQNENIIFKLNLCTCRLVNAIPIYALKQKSGISIAVLTKPSVCSDYPVPGVLGPDMVPMRASVASVAFRGSDSNHLSKIFPADPVSSS